MPQLICSNCRLNTIQAYTFKGTCKKSDDALKLYLTTGNTAFLKSNKAEHKIQVRLFDYSIYLLLIDIFYIYLVIENNPLLKI